MARLTPKIDVLRALFARSGNQCAFPGCTQSLIDDKNKFIGQVCHIEAALPGGERYNPNQTDEERRSYDNLILMCYPHHIETDDVQEYSVEKLKKLNPGTGNSERANLRVRPAKPKNAVSFVSSLFMASFCSSSEDCAYSYSKLILDVSECFVMESSEAQNTDEKKRSLLSPSLSLLNRPLIEFLLLKKVEVL